MQMYPLQIMDILYQPFDKIAIDLIIDLNVSMSEHQHILTIIDYLRDWPEPLQSPGKRQTLLSFVDLGFL